MIASCAALQLVLFVDTTKRQSSRGDRLSCWKRRSNLRVMFGAGWVRYFSEDNCVFAFRCGNNQAPQSHEIATTVGKIQPIAIGAGHTTGGLSQSEALIRAPSSIRRQRFPVPLRSQGEGCAESHCPMHPSDTDYFRGDAAQPARTKMEKHIAEAEQAQRTVRGFLRAFRVQALQQFNKRYDIYFQLAGGERGIRIAK